MRANTVRANERGKNGVIAWLYLELEERHLFECEEIVMKRLIDRGLECDFVFSELLNGLENYQWQQYLLVFVSTAGIWNPDAIVESRNIKKELIELNKRISGLSEELTSSLKHREELCSQHGFSTGSKYHVLDLMDKASADNGRYKSWIAERIQWLRSQFDLKYWPSISDLFEAFHQDSLEATTEPTDEISTQAIRSRKSSKRDFLRALNVALIENSERYHGFLPNDFQLSDEALATLLTVGLGLEESQWIDAAYVKRARQADATL